MTAAAARVPLAETLAAAKKAWEWGSIQFGLGRGRKRPWILCADLDTAALARWEADVASGLTRDFQRTDPRTASAYVLDYVAGVPAYAGALPFHLARRVPHLRPDSLAFQLERQYIYPDSLAVLDPRFWCLPTDPDAGHPHATVVADEAALADRLRREVRGFADVFLAAYSPGATLPARNIPAAFYDALDSALWMSVGEAAPVETVLGLTALVLPGGTPSFAEPSSVYAAVDAQGRAHLTRRRIGCCYYYRVDDKKVACTTCNRVDDAARLARLVEYADAPPEGH